MIATDGQTASSGRSRQGLSPQRLGALVRQAQQQGRSPRTLRRRREALEALTDQFLGLADAQALHVARGPANGHRPELDDLVAEARRGMLQAIATWRPDGGAALPSLIITYARGYARQSIDSHRRHLLPRQPRHHDACPTARTAEILHDGEIDLALLADHRATDDTAGPETAETAELLQRALARLPGRLQAVIRCRFYTGLTLRQTGAALGLAGERVRQLQQQALGLLRREAHSSLRPGGNGHGRPIADERRPQL